MLSETRAGDIFLFFFLMKSPHLVHRATWKLFVYQNLSLAYWDVGCMHVVINLVIIYYIDFYVLFTKKIWDKKRWIRISIWDENGRDQLKKCFGSGFDCTCQEKHVFDVEVCYFCFISKIKNLSYFAVLSYIESLVDEKRVVCQKMTYFVINLWTSLKKCFDIKKKLASFLPF